MSLEKKLKQVTLSVSLRHLLRNKAKSKERTCRNMIELGKELSQVALSEGELGALYQELLSMLDEKNEEELKNWMLGTFRLE